MSCEKIGCIIKCISVLMLFCLLVPLVPLIAQPHHDFKYDPLNLLDHKLSFAYEYIPENGKWGMEVSWERFKRTSSDEHIQFPGVPAWGSYIESVDDYKKHYNGLNFQLKRYFSNQGQGLRQWLGLNLYYQDETKISFIPRSFNTEKIYELEKAASFQGFSIGINFGYKILIRQHWLIEPQGCIRILILPNSSAQLGGGKAMIALNCGYRL